MQSFQILLQILLGGGLFAFMQFLINRYDSKHSKFDGIEKEISALRDEIKKIDKKSDLREAISVRVRILQFNDELLEGKRHSKDSYDQVESDITTYEAFCNTHPDFKNNQTMLTIENINRNYSERLQKRDFLYMEG